MEQPPPYSAAYPPQQPGYPAQQYGYPAQQPGYGPQQPGYPPQQQPGYQQGGPANLGGHMGMMGGAQSMMSGMRSSVLQGGYDSDAEGGRGGNNPMGNSFGDKAIRRAFIRKVYGLLSCQLLLTVAFIAAFLFIEPLKLYVQRSRWLYWVAFALMMVCMLAMACCESVRRKPPTNFIFLGIFTVCQGFMLGTVTAHFDVDAVLMAVGITAGVTLALTLFAFQTKYDFTTCGGMLCGATVVLMIAGILMIFLPYNKYAYIGYASAGALIFSMYIVYDTQLMMGGSHKYSLDPEEYVFAALSIYLDIINLFLYILMIIGASRSD